MKIEELTKLIIKELKDTNKDLELEAKQEDLTTDVKETNNNEKIFLEAVKERILVLFEGLNNFDKGDIEARVELSLKFMEFLLATIEDRLKKLQ